MKTHSSFGVVVFLVGLFLSLGGGDCVTQGQESPIRFNKNFPGAAIGKIVRLGDNDYRCSVDGQYDQFGRNRQPSWFYFRIDGRTGQTVTLRLTQFDREYNNQPRKPDWSRERPLISSDQVNWSSIAETKWDAESEELIFTVTLDSDSVWVAYIPPYLESELSLLIADSQPSERVRCESIGKTLQGREITLFTVTDFSVSLTEKKNIWIVARLHAWESLTSFVADGAVRFLTTDSLEAIDICRKAVFHIVVMPDIDSCQAGLVRFNLNGYDLNRRWLQVDLTGPASKESLRERPEVWYLKKAVVDSNRQKPIELFLNLHNQHTGYDSIDASGDSPDFSERYSRFEESMERPPFFLTRPNARGRIYRSRRASPGRVGMADEIWNEYGIPHVLVEYNINRKADTDYYLTREDAADNGAQLVRAAIAF